MLIKPGEIIVKAGEVKCRSSAVLFLTQKRGFMATIFILLQLTQTRVVSRARRLSFRAFFAYAYRIQI